MKKQLLVSLLASILAPSLYAEELELDDVSVSASGFKRKDTEATYTSEIHTAKQIAKSGASTLFDYLAQQTSLNIQPSYGNRATPSVNLRGFGGENGFQNVVITVDGQRLNNIDGVPQLLAGIPLSNIERIEISKGSGSVRFGDGATSGAIQIYTKSKSGVTVSTSWGNFGQQNHAISAGFTEKHIELSMNAAHDSYDGFSKPDATGHRDNFDSNTQNAKIKIKPTEDFRVFAQATNSRNDIRYVNPITLQQFQNNPRSVSLTNPIYLHQALNSTRWQIGAEYDLSSAWHIDASHTREEKLSDYISSSPSQSNYVYESDIVNLRYDTESLSAISGFQKYNGYRSTISPYTANNNTTKDNRAFFVNFEYRPIEDWTLSAGARTEKVNYAYNPDGGLSLKDSKNLNAWDTGVNYRVNSQISIFANYNDAFQAPDIDRFFSTDFTTGKTTFNGFIKPMHTKTANIGLNHTTTSNRLKASIFYVSLNDEFYLNPITFINTNITQSHKYGLEIQDFYEINEKLSSSLIYNYVHAVMDQIANGNTSYNGKILPGVPSHSIVGNLNWKFYPDASLNLNQTWRSKAYAYNDFSNSLSQKQPAYFSTNLAINYKYQKVTVFAAINNIFKHKNAIAVDENAIYPFDFVRSMRLGVRADF